VASMQGSVIYQPRNKNEVLGKGGTCPSGGGRSIRYEMKANPMWKTTSAPLDKKSKQAKQLLLAGWVKRDPRGAPLAAGTKMQVGVVREDSELLLKSSEKKKLAQGGGGRNAS